ncbi:MAG TPA: ATP-grasp domain-containing protein, partial [Arenibaculum sp.]|nr:ATP-grasp domain-containing protein [Arenibaculum sp.]
IGYPVIVKPVDGGGSIGIVRADGPEDVRAGFVRLDGLGIADVIVEEFLDGPEFSVEAFSFAGRHVVLAITEKIVGANFIEMGHALPADLPEETGRTVEDFVAEFLTIVGLDDGPSHTELKLTSKGPRIIESHNRIGGDKIGLLVDAALGVNLVDLSFGWAAGILPALDRVPPGRCSSAVRFLSVPPGRIERIEGLDRLRAAEDVLEFDFRHSVGETIGLVTENLERSGFVAVTAPTTGEARARAEALAGEVVVTTAI